MQELSIEGFRLSPQQKRLWLLQKDANHRVYRTQCAVRIQGKLNREKLELSIQRIVEKYEILRTNFQALSGMNVPLQIITTNRLPILRYHNLTDLDPETQQAQIEALFNQTNQLAFDVEQGAVLDISWVILAPNKQILLVSLPALNSDAVSIENFVRELSRFYAAELPNQEWVEQPLQYVDIAEWQNEFFAGEEVELGKKYWQTKDLSGLANWQLPQENMPAQKRAFEPKFIPVGLNSETVANLDAIAQNYNTSISALLQACWTILLWRLTGRSNVVVGTYFDGRNYEELEPTLGLLAKYLPIDSQLDDTTRLSDVCKQIDDATENAEKWQEAFNWEQVAGVTEHNLGSCFFPYSFEFREQPGEYTVADVSFSIDQQYACIEPFKVKLSCLKRHDTLVTEFHYDANLFQHQEIERLARYFQTLLTRVIEKPDVTIGKLEILSQSDRYQLLVEFNNTQTDYSKQLCIHQFIEQQAEQTPDKIAVSIENQQLTYAQLNTRANQLAHHLQSLGVSAETVVALCVERSLDMIVGVLGILKAGGAYLPIDPILPSDRITFMVHDAQASVILTQQHLVEQFAEDTATLVCLDADWQTITQQPEETPPCPAMPENLVYVIYTSGSTGNPKGVAVEHRQLVNYLHGILARLDVPPGASFATVSTLAADLGNTAIFSALCTGGCLHVISQERATSPEAFIDYCESHRIDCLKIVPSHLNALLTASQPEKLLPRKYLILGGEALSWQLVEKIREYAPSCQILNHYGPTETTVGVLTYPVQERMRDQSETVPIGRAIANTQSYILDHYLQPVPIGVPGELYIGGDNVARGYVNQPQLTAERFITIQDWGIEDTLPKRVYKTGDLARYLPDGTIEFLGRIDHQVKIHGFRIELGEIESLLTQHPAIRDAIVLAQEDELSHKRLVAYIVPTQESVRINQLRDFLKQQLPDYMIPSVFVPLKALPLTPNGKVNRQGLPDPDSVKPEMEGRFVAPRTPVEETIAKIWGQVLGRDRISINDNFFELGGDSILSIQIVARANQAGLQLAPKQLFEFPTVAELAAKVETAPTLHAAPGLVMGAIPLTPTQHWFFEQERLQPNSWHQALLLEVRGGIDPDGLKQAVQHLLEHHDALRLRFSTTESGWQQVNAGVDAIADVPFSYIDLSGLPAAERETALEVTASELQTSLNLADGLILRVALFNLGDHQPNHLLVVAHRLAVDRVSWRILLEDLQQLYQQISQGEAVQLPAKTLSFKQWSELLQEYAQSAQLQQERDYWLQAFHHSRLPLDNPDGTNTATSAHIVSVSLSVEETQALLQDVPAAYQTQIDDALLAALVQSFSQWTGVSSLLVDVEGNGREARMQGTRFVNADELDVSRTVGCFTTIFPVLLTLAGILEPGEALKVIKEQRRSVPNHGIGYGVLRYLSEDPLVTPQAEVCFKYLSQFDSFLPESSLFEQIYPVPSPTKLRSNRVFRQDRHKDVGRSGRGENLLHLNATWHQNVNRRYLLEINAFVLRSQLQVEWTYSEQVYQQTTIEQLAEGFVEALRSLIAHCQSPEAGGYTPSDFPQANLNQKDLEQFLAKINRNQ